MQNTGDESQNEEPKNYGPSGEAYADQSATVPPTSSNNPDQVLHIFFELEC